jgi:hypothetical protein
MGPVWMIVGPLRYPFPKYDIRCTKYEKQNKVHVDNFQGLLLPRTKNPAGRQLVVKGSGRGAGIGGSNRGVYI